VAFTAGQKLTAAQLNNITSFSKFASATAAIQAATTSAVDLAGATVTFNAPVANTQVTVRAYLDVEASGSVDIFIGALQLDGVTQTGQVHHQATGRAGIAQEWILNGLSAGSHTVKIRISKLNSSNTVNVGGSGHSKIVVTGNGIS
jgi:hypothetical protein